ncbi:voltage-gated potassium channel subunit beta-2-like isoform X2 [Macrosteles quadrilineatus]|uniref:voltage-gated potassium channel subunit beta-2-like isoform X2 n=1 Tax=Macrosteles quadrilineatus TaxID=74068 RepID=UPI0023E28A18|nr:voltage-gated potassium channel subunit beta-2-like isoform X2 [Macrosteles quadrilineatus]XP_054271925.1 voltage-gated potassium channel subunit beta-2-like isoform X2 [Macrosteles quadrilineatus]
MSQIMLCSLAGDSNVNVSDTNNNRNNATEEDDIFPIPTIYRCRAPIASLDCMEEFQSTNEQLCMQLQQPCSKEQLLLQNINTPSVTRQSSTVTPGLRYRNIGKSGLRVSNVGLGTWVTFGNNVSEEQAEAVVQAAYESGINVFDLSEAHCGIRAELELGHILQKKGWKRSSYIVTTKIYWNSKSEERGLSRKHIIESVRASLARLQLSYIDVVIVHRADPMCPTEEVVRAMHHVIGQGWVMYWGTAKWTPVEVMEAYTNCRQFNCITPIIEQTEYHMFCREKTELYMPELYNKIGVGLMAWSPLAMGLVSGKIDDGGLPVLSRSSMKNKYSSFSHSWTEDETQSTKEERMQPEDNRRQQEKLREVAQVAERLGCSVIQLSIAWCLKNDSVQCLLLGATSVEQLYQAIHSLQMVPKLNTNTMNELERILDNKPSRPPMVSTLALR